MGRTSGRPWTPSTSPTSATADFSTVQKRGIWRKPHVQSVALNALKISLPTGDSPVVAVYTAITQQRWKQQHTSWRVMVPKCRACSKDGKKGRKEKALGHFERTNFSARCSAVRTIFPADSRIRPQPLLAETRVAASDERIRLSRSEMISVQDVSIKGHGWLWPVVNRPRKQEKKKEEKTVWRGRLLSLQRHD